MALFLWASDIFFTLYEVSSIFFRASYGAGLSNQLYCSSHLKLISSLAFLFEYTVYLGQSRVIPLLPEAQTENFQKSREFNHPKQVEAKRPGHSLQLQL